MEFTTKAGNSVKVTREDTFTDYARIVDVFGQGSQVPLKKGVDDFDVSFTIEITMKDGRQEVFSIDFATEERTDNIKAYNGYEMVLSNCETLDCEELFEDDEEIIETLQKRADELCKEYLEEWIRDNG